MGICRENTGAASGDDLVILDVGSLRDNPGCDRAAASTFYAGMSKTFFFYLPSMHIGKGNNGSSPLSVG